MCQQTVCSTNRSKNISNIDRVFFSDDILRARLKTLGVSEHRFTLKAGESITHPAILPHSLKSALLGNMLSHDWRVYDVGGARSLVRPFSSCSFGDKFSQIIALFLSLARFADPSLIKSVNSSFLLFNNSGLGALLR